MKPKHAARFVKTCRWICIFYALGMFMIHFQLSRNPLTSRATKIYQVELVLLLYFILFCHHVSKLDLRVFRSTRTKTILSVHSSQRQRSTSKRRERFHPRTLVQWLRTNVPLFNSIYVQVFLAIFGDFGVFGVGGHYYEFRLVLREVFEM